MSGFRPLLVYGEPLLGSTLPLCGPTRCERGLVWTSVQDTAWFIPKKIYKGSLVFLYNLKICNNS